MANLEPVYESKNYYLLRNLPHIIGSAQFMVRSWMTHSFFFIPTTHLPKESISILIRTTDWLDWSTWRERHLQLTYMRNRSLPIVTARRAPLRQEQQESNQSILSAVIPITTSIPCIQLNRGQKATDCRSTVTSRWHHNLSKDWLQAWNCNC